MDLDEIRRFYDEIGWVRDSDGFFFDDDRFGDGDVIFERSTRRRRSLFSGAFFSCGEYFLDAGCGPHPFADIIGGYANYVCLDVSLTGLKEARQRFVEALYVNADMRRLPFKAGVFDSALMAHSLVHMGWDEMRSALEETARAIRPGSSIIALTYNPEPLLYPGRRSQAEDLCADHLKAWQPLKDFIVKAPISRYLGLASADLKVSVRPYSLLPRDLERRLLRCGPLSSIISHFLHLIEGQLPRHSARFCVDIIVKITKVR